MVIKLKYGNTNTYFINGLLIDTDYAGMLPAFYKEIKKKRDSADRYKICSRNALSSRSYGAYQRIYGAWSKIAADRTSARIRSLFGRDISS